MHKKQLAHLPVTIIMLLPVAILLVGLSICFKKGGFDTAKIQSNLPFNDYWEIEPLSDAQKEWLSKKVLSQEYYYLGADRYCYVFSSQDQEYVIRFFKKNGWSPKGWLQEHPLTFLRYFGYPSHTDSPYLSEHLFTNYKEVYETFRHETDLIYLHLNKHREFREPLIVVDTSGLKHPVDLNRVEFVVQRKGEPIFEKLATLAMQKEERKFREAVRSFFSLIAISCEKGFASQHTLLENQFGFVEDRAIYFDCSKLCRDVSMKSPFNTREELIRAADQLNAWIMDLYPHLSLIVQEEAIRVIDQSFEAKEHVAQSKGASFRLLQKAP
ncbi:MAG: hypothetical protein RLZZ453_805 [Chlamydiota bacterium]|jgi:hypothetical protein